MEHEYSSNTPGVRLDGSWELLILVTDLQMEKCLRVRGDHHVGGIMIKLVNELDIAMDWSDHALWWPERNRWLDKTRWTLDQYHITADTLIHFTPMHKNIRVQLPDLRYVDCVLDFSVRAFSALRSLCSDLEIRHFEELSLCKPLATDHLKFNYGDFRQEEEKKRRLTLKNSNLNNSNSSSPNGTFRRRGKANHHHSVSTSDLSPSTAIVDRPDTNTFIANSTATLGRKTSTTSWNGGGNNSPSRNYRSLGRNGTLEHQRRKSDFHSNHGTLRKNGSFSPLINGNEVNIKTGSEWSLAMSPPPSVEAKDSLIRPKNLVERARMNVAWMDSSLSLMEQGVKDFDTLLLRYKFYSFYDLSPRLDGVRINLIYEQLKWIVLNENIDCTEEEMMLFAALHLQVSLQANVPQPCDEDEEEDDDVEAALSDLQISLEGEASHSFGMKEAVSTDLVDIPVLADHMRYLKPKRFTLKGYKRHYFVLKELDLFAYKNQEDSLKIPPSFSVSLKGCEISPDVNLSRKNFGIKLAIPSADGMSDLFLRLSSEEMYAKWMAACRLAAKGKSMADASYDSEVKSIRAFLSMQHPASSPVINPSTLNVDVEEYVAARFLRKVPKSKLRQRILEAHSNVKDLNLIEAKMNYLKAFQSLPDYGVSLFVVRFHGEKKDELLGIAHNRLMRMNLQTGDPVKTWRYNTIKAWNINWETKHMMIQLGDGRNVIFKCLSADCKVVHEFIGGYIYLSMRGRDLNQSINEELFHKLTGGWH
eukprot:TRINITY_DN1986_c0_g1_i1.p1 TRINITY_DN1986_c0_g1~~TRINITY_DN1986_c0_g1_i1.p1  ORF type:complete len:758 (-),score=259.79 TRINITY_DN1986_c0_g1_i1:769-3042(-)